jgi:hypothetical protein
MNATLILILNLVATILPKLLGDKPGIQAIIDTIVQLTPALVKSARETYAIVSGIITVLQQKGDVTDEQLDQLMAVQKQMDDAFEEVAKSFEGDPATAAK